MPILATPEEIINLKLWVKNEMPDDVWTPVTQKQQSAFKVLIVEWYGWPVFSLNFNSEMNKIMKCNL